MKTKTPKTLKTPKVQPQFSLPDWLKEQAYQDQGWDYINRVDPDPTPDTTEPAPEKPESTPDNPETSESTSEKPEKPEQPESTPEVPEQPGLTQEQLLEMVAALVAKNTPEKPETKPTPETPEAEPEKPESTPETPESSEIELMKSLVRDVMIQQAKVPDSLKPLLPSDTTKLSSFLASEEYQKLAQALAPKPVSKPAQPEPEPASDKDKDTAKPKTFDEVSTTMLSQFDSLLNL
jgi:hypothetical protein